jgi:hypothetical protein
VVRGDVEHERGVVGVRPDVGGRGVPEPPRADVERLNGLPVGIRIECAGRVGQVGSHVKRTAGTGIGPPSCQPQQPSL